MVYVSPDPDPPHPPPQGVPTCRSVQIVVYESRTLLRICQKIELQSDHEKKYQSQYRKIYGSDPQPPKAYDLLALSHLNHLVTQAL